MCVAFVPRHGPEHVSGNADTVRKSPGLGVGQVWIWISALLLPSQGLWTSRLGSQSRSQAGNRVRATHPHLGSGWKDLAPSAPSSQLRSLRWRFSEADSRDASLAGFLPSLSPVGLRGHRVCLEGWVLRFLSCQPTSRDWGGDPMLTPVDGHSLEACRAPRGAVSPCCRSRPQTAVLRCCLQLCPPPRPGHSQKAAQDGSGGAEGAVPGSLPT